VPKTKFFQTISEPIKETKKTQKADSDTANEDSDE
jgi:hypothetical protein